MSVKDFLTVKRTASWDVVNGIAEVSTKTFQVSPPVTQKTYFVPN